tara:strand:+ start:345 stop:893 length:549 start_codon:yes stop_codon:yes gene_type:complete
MDINLIRNKMDTSVNFFEKEISSIRTSRANPSILDNILVESYGNRTPINQLGTISSPDANLITIQVWDTSLTNLIEKAISESNIGINPQTEGQLIRLPIPKLSEERRQELAKLVSQYAEQSKIAIRNNRRDFLDKIKKDNKDKLISEDDFKKYSNQVQEITDEYISKIDEIVTNKQSEIMKV